MNDQASVEARSSVHTCLACRVAFDTADEQRSHYRSDWHRYNLKRKVAELPPVPLHQFNEKIESKQQQMDNAAAAKSKSGENDYCSICRKSFRSENSYLNHLQSQKHKAELKGMSERSVDKGEKKEKARPLPRMVTTDDMTEEQVKEMIDERIKLAPRLEDTDCLFCPSQHETFEQNMEHMTLAHSFFIPDMKYLVDLRGLIRYLGEKISVGNVCLYCNGRGRELRSLEAVRTHMTDKGHCKIAYDDDEDASELVDFYDFSSSYGNIVDDVDIDAELDQNTRRVTLDDDGLSLVLPNGVIIGHRSLQRYYSQRFKPEDARESVLINKLVGYYDDPSLSSTPLRSPTNRQLRITNGTQDKAQKRILLKESRARENFKTRIGIRNNGLQKHFREQII